MEGQTLGKGSFARVELAHHSVTGVKVRIHHYFEKIHNRDVSIQTSGPAHDGPEVLDEMYLLKPFVKLKHSFSRMCVVNHHFTFQ